jgi:RHS repeat-associated protein
MAAKRKSSWLLLLISLVASSALASVPRPDTPLQPLTAADRWELFAETADVDSDQLIRRTGLAWLEPISRLQLPQEEISINEVVPFDAEPRRSLFAVSRELASGPRNPAEENNISDLSELDAESWQGHDYMHARYYSPVLGRFLSVDPVINMKRVMTEPQGWNRYAYVSNNPINKVDPDGRDEYAMDQRLTGLKDDWHGRNKQEVGFLLGAVSLVAPGPEDIVLGGWALNAGVKFLGRMMGKWDGVMNTSTIRFTQDSVGKAFKDGSGTLSDLVKGLKDGSVKTTDVPAIRVFQKDGKWYTLDNRRLEAFKQADVKNIPIKKATQEEIEKEAWKFTTKNDGASVRVRN